MIPDETSHDLSYGFLIAATRRSSGKTMLSVGLCAELKRRGMNVCPYKKGPDYIDPMWLSHAAGTPCLNLDFKTQTTAELKSAVTAIDEDHAGKNKVTIVEGNMALHDGMEEDGGDSNAGLAILLNLPVVLVVDSRGMTRSVAAHVLGYERFDPAVRFAGIVLNRVASKRHEQSLRTAIATHTTLPVLGAIYENERLELTERQLGLIPANEHRRASAWTSATRDVVAKQMDIDAFLAATRTDKPLRPPRAHKTASSQRDKKKTNGVTVGVFRDEAFGFYYPDDLVSMQSCGARLIEINALSDKRLPAVDALWIGGGFPEMRGQALAENRALRTEVKAALNDGMPAYAECGGMIYLARTMAWRGETYEMTGALEADVVIHDKPCGRGYIRIEETNEMPWPERPKGAYYAHEFHYSELVNVADYPRAYKVIRGVGAGAGMDGLICANILASYAHRRDTQRNRWTRRFCQFIRQTMAER